MIKFFIRQFELAREYGLRLLFWIKGKVSLHPKFWIFNLSIWTLCLIAGIFFFSQDGNLVYQIKKTDKVIVVLDIGHGGLDPGTPGPKISGGGAPVYEHAVAFDVGARVAHLLADKVGYVVLPTLIDSKRYLPISNLMTPIVTQNPVLQTTPKCDLRRIKGNETVNLRWILSNYWARAIRKDGEFSEKTIIFLSLHCDSAPVGGPGVTIYIPPGPTAVPVGLQLGLYRRYSEASEYFSKMDNEIDPDDSFAQSEALAKSLVASFKLSGVGVNKKEEIKNRVNGETRFVPAVLRYNEIPARVLVEMANFASADDRFLVQNPAFREKLAESLVLGIEEYIKMEK